VNMADVGDRFAATLHVTEPISTYAKRGSDWRTLGIGGAPRARTSHKGTIDVAWASVWRVTRLPA
jgi:hypothetical protein